MCSLSADGPRVFRPLPEAGIDFDRANAARIYDYFLGGGHNFAVDREAAARVTAGHPDTAYVAQCMRAYMGRAVRWCSARGIDQFLDLGSGIPTVGNVHEIALQENGDARVAYVDFEPVAVAHSTELLADVPHATITAADARDVGAVLQAPGVRDMIDFARPTAVIAVGLLHFVEDDDLDAMLSGYRDVLVPGSVLVVNHGSDDHDDPDLARRMREGAEGYRGTATEFHLRDRTRILSLLEGFDPVDPGLVDIIDWPEPAPGRRPTGVLGAVGLLGTP